MAVDYVAYFKSLVERDPSAERWTAWWEAHKNEMATLVPRGIYLRLAAPSSEQHYMAVFAALEAAGFHYQRPKHYRHPKFHDPQPVPAMSLQKQVSLAQLEEASFCPDTRENELAAIRENLKQEDEIWTFYWATAGTISEGFAFVRDGIPYDHLSTSRTFITLIPKAEQFKTEPGEQ